MAGIELADAIRDLRSQLTRAAQEANDSDIKFELGPIELELQVAASKEAGAEAGVKWLVFNAGAQTNFAAESTQTLKLTLNPKDGQGNTISVSNQGQSRPD